MIGLLDVGLAESGSILTRDENILVWCPGELHCFQSKNSHVLVSGISGDVFVRTVVECNQDVQQDYFRELVTKKKGISKHGVNPPIIITKLNR